MLHDTTISTAAGLHGNRQPTAAWPPAHAWVEYADLWQTIVHRQVLMVLERYQAADVADVLFGAEQPHECATRLQQTRTQIDRTLRRARYRLRNDPVIQNLWQCLPRASDYAV